MMDERRREYEETRARFAAIHDKVTAFNLHALHSTVEPRADWRDAVEDAVDDLVELVERLDHPDLLDLGHNVMRNLTGIWLDVDEVDRLTHPEMFDDPSGGQ